MVNFITELMPPVTSDPDGDHTWTMYVDGSSNDIGCAKHVLLLAPDGMLF